VGWGRGSTFDLEEKIIEIAPPPVLIGLIGADERVIFVLVEVSGGVLAR